jgi:hypothetical protein
MSRKTRVRPLNCSIWQSKGPKLILASSKKAVAVHYLHKTNYNNAESMIEFTRHFNIQDDQLQKIHAIIRTESFKV